MSPVKTITPTIAPKAELQRQVRQAQRLVREARRALTKLEQKSGVVLIVQRPRASSTR